MRKKKYSFKKIRRFITNCLPSDEELRKKFAAEDRSDRVRIYDTKRMIAVAESLKGYLSSQRDNLRKMLRRNELSKLDDLVEIAEKAGKTGYMPRRFYNEEYNIDGEDVPQVVMLNQLTSSQIVKKWAERYHFKGYKSKN